jgi:hypothetical protein
MRTKCYRNPAFIMRTIDRSPDSMFHKARALAALQGSSMKDPIVRAVEREAESVSTRQTKVKKSQDEPLGVGEVAGLKLAHIRLKDGQKLDLTGFDFDDFLG